MFLGIDCSTQSLKIIVISESQEKLYEVVVVYDEDLANYNTTNGVIRHNVNGIEHISTPTVLFIEALELAIAKLKVQCDFSKIKAISGSGQQHGSVWWKHGSINTLNQLKTAKTNEQPLSVIFKDSFSLEMSPIWMDNSTSVECKEITEEYGSADKLADITGSRAYERFTGPQIKHVYKHQRQVYENTEHISLISSFLPSLLIGNYSPIDYSDGSGMNILDIHNHSWDECLLDLIAPNLSKKLGDAKFSGYKVGEIADYWSNKYGFTRGCEIYAFSGDNPCTVIGLDLTSPGDIGLSLGTSDVLFGVTKTPIPNSDEGSILIHPLDIEYYMMMLVYKNGATTRKFIRDSLSQDDKEWIHFSKCIAETPAGNNGNISFYYKETEITPNISTTGIVKYNKDDELVNDVTIESNDCRGIIESQALSYKHHSRLLGLNKINRIVVTGGGSVNREILQIIADVFEMEVTPSLLTNTAALGAAVRALIAHHKHNRKTMPSKSLKSSSSLVIQPNEANFSIYRQLLVRYSHLEKKTAEMLNKNVGNSKIEDE